MKRPTMLVQAVLDQLALDLDLSVERDKQLVAYRCKHEGLSFLTITLPLLSDALEQGIEVGTFTCPTQFCRHGRLPRFLGGFFKRVFNKDGTLLEDPCPYTIAGIRQICRFFKKLKIDCTPRRTMRAADNFLQIERELRMATSQVERKDTILDKISGIIWAQVFPEPDYHKLVCHHGPGVTADRYGANARYRIRFWNDRSELTFPSDLHCYPNYWVASESSGCTASSGGVEYLSVSQEIGVRVTFVPKTLVAPRVIAIEPAHVQYMQQSVKDMLYVELERNPMTRNSIRFTDQTVNQSLAYRSSIDRRLATLDLKDASDRVHLHLVQRIFKTSGLLELLEDARSLHATLPDGRNIVLTKYASMGSALCFPVEAMVFYTLIQSAMHLLDGVRPSSRSIKKYSKSIDIYGDDIIVPVEYADFVVKYLESYALKVNGHKSFRISHFRESCGGDFYNGVDVKPVYAREVPFDLSQHWEPSTIMSWVSTADQFYLKGQWHLAATIHEMVCQVVRRPIPRSRTPGSGVAFFSLLFTTHLHWNANWQCWQQKRLFFQPSKMKDEIDGDEIACLNKWGLYASRRQVDSDGDAQHRTERFRSIRRELHVSDSIGRGILGLSCSGTGNGYESVLRVQDTDHSVRDSRTDVETVAAWSYGLYPSRATDAGRIARSLVKDGEPLDFCASTKRGAFKSKRRWITLAG